LKIELIFLSKIQQLERRTAKIAVFNIQALGFIFHYSKERLEINPGSGEPGVIHGTT
jgi:hypothetical protein